MKAQHAGFKDVVKECLHSSYTYQAVKDNAHPLAGLKESGKMREKMIIERMEKEMLKEQGPPSPAKPSEAAIKFITPRRKGLKSRIAGPEDKKERSESASSSGDDPEALKKLFRKGIRKIKLYTK